MEYYYTKKENVDLNNKELRIDGFEYKHLVKVLRKLPGEKITLTDGERNIYNCEIKEISKEKISCYIISCEYNLFEPEVNISLYISPLRNLSRFEFAIEKAVELGVTSIHPVITEHTISKNVFSKTKTERFKKIIIGAMGQSQRCVLTEFHDAITFGDFIKNTEMITDKIVMYEFSDNVSEIKLSHKTECLSLLIGPEGGFSHKEIDILKENRWLIRSLGKRKLRAETAAIVSVYDIISKLN